MKLKGKLTKLSAALLALMQTPNLIADVTNSAEVFAASVEQPVSVISVVAAAGVIWGGIRRAFNYFGS
jgi:hypothetical protein